MLIYIFGKSILEDKILNEIEIEIFLIPMSRSAFTASVCFSCFSDFSADLSKSLSKTAEPGSWVNNEHDSLILEKSFHL